MKKLKYVIPSAALVTLFMLTLFSATLVSPVSAWGTMDGVPDEFDRNDTIYPHPKYHIGYGVYVGWFEVHLQRQVFWEYNSAADGCEEEWHEGGTDLLWIKTGSVWVSSLGNHWIDYEFSDSLRIVDLNYAQELQHYDCGCYLPPPDWNYGNYHIWENVKYSVKYVSTWYWLGESHGMEYAYTFHNEL